MFFREDPYNMTILNQINLGILLWQRTNRVGCSQLEYITQVYNPTAKFLNLLYLQLNNRDLKLIIRIFCALCEKSEKMYINFEKSHIKKSHFSHFSHINPSDTQKLLSEKSETIPLDF